MRKTPPTSSLFCDAGVSGLTLWLCSGLQVLLEVQSGSTWQVPQDGTQRGDLVQTLHRFPFMFSVLCLLAPALLLLDYMTQEVLCQSLGNSLNFILWLRWVRAYGQNLSIGMAWKSNE